MFSGGLLTKTKTNRVAQKLRRSAPVLLAFAIWFARLAGSDGKSELPGMPPVMDANDIYSETRAGKLSPAAKGFPDLVYVPNSGSNTVDVIDPRTFHIVNHFKVGR